MLNFFWLADTEPRTRLMGTCLRWHCELCHSYSTRHLRDSQRDFCAYCKQHLFLVLITYKCLTCLYPTWFTMPADSSSREILMQTLESICKKQMFNLCPSFPPQLMPQRGLKKQSASLSRFDNWENRGERKARRGFLKSMRHTEPAPAGEQQC